MTGQVPSRPRFIVHVDMDAFYASVEQMDHPELKGKPVIVGGAREERGVVSAASYEARKYGVTSAMPTKRALKLCPEAVFLRCRFERYEEVSRRIFEILQSYTPLVEGLSLDEAFLDLTGRVRSIEEAAEIAREIKARIREEVDLVASVGVAPNKFLAKLASDLKKPDGFFVIRLEEAHAVLRDLPVRRIWGVGEVTEKVLASIGMEKIGEIQNAPLELLRERLGSYADDLVELAHGIDESEVVPEREAKSLGSEETFPIDLRDEEELLKRLWALVEGVSGRLRESGLSTRTIQIKVRFSNFRTITRSHTLKSPTDSLDVIWKNARELLQEKVRLDLAVRLLGVSLSGLGEKGPEQLLLFPDPAAKLRKLDSTMDRIRSKHGERSIYRGRLLEDGRR